MLKRESVIAGSEKYFIFATVIRLWDSFKKQMTYSRSDTANTERIYKNRRHVPLGLRFCFYKHIKRTPLLV